MLQWITGRVRARALKLPPNELAFELTLSAGHLCGSKTLLPAGDYSISMDEASVVVFWNKKANVGQHAFLIPGHLVPSKDYRLLFIVHDRRHYLRVIWYLDGAEVLSSQCHVSPAADDTEEQVALSVQTNVTNVAQGHD